MLTYHRTSILSSKAQTVVNTVNTVGVMGKGIAAAFKARYPDMFRTYQQLCREHRLQIGMLWLWKAPDQWVLNFPTKEHWRNPSKLSYIEAGLRKFVSAYESRGIREISFPRLGCGNGGLDWRDVQPLMKQYLGQLPIPIYIHDFEKDIGVPEHQDRNSTTFERSFETFVGHTRREVELRRGRFVTVTNKTPFKAEFDLKGNLWFERNDRRGQINPDDLYEVWSLLLRGPVTRRQLPGTTRDWDYYLFAVLSQLPYVRIVEVSQRDDTPGLAIEIVDNGEAELVDAARVATQ